MAHHQYRTKSGNNYSFSQVPKAQIPRSSFIRNHTHKTTFDAGYLIPIYLDEVLPGDTFNLKMDVFGRLATPIFPIMDGLYLESFFFFVPNRLLWDNWKYFMGEKVNPDDSTEYAVPVLSNTADITALSLADYFGLPIGKTMTYVSSLPFRAYNLIWNEWFRDENLQDSVTVPKGNGPDTQSTFTLLKRGKRHDYFTSCLPWPQKGPGVEIALGVSAPVTISASSPYYPTFTTATDSATPEPIFMDSTAGTKTILADLESNSGPAKDPLLWNQPRLAGVADLSDASTITINSLRQAFQLQKLQERDARGGTRYTEILQAHFGVISPDARLQRPEYLGGGHSPIIINPVTQTSGTGITNQDSPQGNMAAYGIVAGQGHGFVKSFTEHGYIIGLICARADLSYQQGLHRMWTRQSKYDFYWPALAHIGEQAVLNKEIYCQGYGVGDPGEQDDDVFGYQERWAEYRYGISKITGKFRSTDATPLDSWHLAQEFTSLPVLGDTFIKETPPIDRVVAVNTEPDFIFDSFFRINCVRPMPVYSVPGLIDHF